MGNAQGTEGGVFMSSGSLQSSSHDSGDSLKEGSREGSSKCTARLLGVLMLVPGVPDSAPVCARSQAADRTTGSNGTKPALRKTSAEEERRRSGGDSQRSRLASGQYTESAVETAEVRVHVKQHAFFEGFDWRGLLQKRLPAPLQPDVTTPEVCVCMHMHMHTLCLCSMPQCHCVSMSPCLCLHVSMSMCLCVYVSMCCAALWACTLDNSSIC